MNNDFVDQFSKNIKLNYTSFDRVIIRGYILPFFSLGSIVNYLKAIGYKKSHHGIMRILTDQLNAHISKEAAKSDILTA